MEATQKSVQDNPGRILVIGGRGFLGRRVVDALNGAGVDVTTGSRRTESGDVHIDLCAPDTFAAVDGFDVVVNCSDTLAAPPDALLDHCLARGVAFVDAGADADTIERMLTDAPGNGVAVVGAGLFPGISNLLAAQVIADAGPDPSVAIEIALNPMSGAGPGTVALMSNSIAVKTLRWPEQVMLPVTASLDPDRVSVDIVPSFKLARPLARFASRLKPRWRWLRRAIAGITGGMFRVMRTWVLRWRAGAVTITAVAGAARRSVFTRNGFDITAYSVAATALLVMRKSLESGRYCVDQVTTMAELVREMRALAGDDLALRFEPDRDD